MVVIEIEIEIESHACQTQMVKNFLKIHRRTGIFAAEESTVGLLEVRFDVEKPVIYPIGIDLDGIGPDESRCDFHENISVLQLLLV